MRRVCVTMRGTRVGRQCLNASELARNRTRPRPSTDAPRSYHAWTAHVSRSFHWQSRTKRGTFAKCACSDAFRQWFIRRACVGCSWKTAAYLLDCVDVHDMSVIVSDTCAVHAWFISDFYPRHPEKLVNFLTHKHAQTQSVRDLWVIRAWSAVWLALTGDFLSLCSDTFFGMIQQNCVGDDNQQQIYRCVLIVKGCPFLGLYKTLTRCMKIIIQEIY
jgi:hypothetical protein